MKKLIRRFIEDKDVYPSASVVLTVLMDEYSKSKETAQMIDNKVLALLTTLLAILTIYVPLIPFEDIVVIYVFGTTAKLVLLGSAITLIFISIVCSLVCFVKLIRVFKFQPYRWVEVQNIVKEELLEIDKDEMEKELCLHYRRIVENNNKINEDKTKKIKGCFEAIILVFFLLFFSTVVLSII